MAGQRPLGAVEEVGTSSQLAAEQLSLLAKTNTVQQLLQILIQYSCKYEYNTLANTNMVQHLLQIQIW